MISLPYTLFTRIPLYADATGAVYADDLWAKDLAFHLTYIADFRICCPCLPATARPEGATVVAGLTPDRIISLQPVKGWKAVIRTLWSNFVQVRRAVRDTQIVHSGGAGWPFPLSFYILPLRRKRDFQWIMVIESSFWMKPRHGPVSVRQHLSHAFHHHMIRACMRAADAHIVTQSWYRDLFLDPEAPVHVAPAVWIDEDDILAAAPDTPKRGTGPARLIFPARLVPDKGVETVLQAIETFAARHSTEAAPVLQIDIIGAGPLAERCRNFAAQDHGAVAVRFLDPVPYGAPFFALLGEYEAVVLANRQPEQPRIVFDAFSQAVPVIASRTPGVESSVIDGHTGWLFAVDDVVALATLFERVIAQPRNLADMGAAAHKAVANRTHMRMHKDREAFLKTRLRLQADPN